MGGGERAPVALCREPTEPAGETGVGFLELATQVRRRPGRRPIALGARAAAAPGSLSSRLRRS